MSTNAFEPPQRYVPGRPPAPSTGGQVTITGFDVMQTSKCMAVAAMLLTLPLLLVGLAGGVKVLGLVLLPVINLAGGFLIGLIYSISYNLAASWVGGISFRQDRIGSRD